MADPVGERRLVAAPERGLLERRHLTRGDVDDVAAVVDAASARTRPPRRDRTRPAPSRWPRSARSSACPPATPPGTRRTPRAGTGRAPRATRRNRHRAGWPAATGTTTAGTRGPVQLEQVEPGLPRAPRVARHELVADRVHVGAGHRRAGPGCAARTAAPRARSPPSCLGPQRLVDPLPHQLGRALAARVPDLGADRAAAVRVRERRRSASTPRRARRGTCPRTPGVIRPIVRDADHLGHHQRRRRRARGRRGARGGSRPACRRRRSTCPSARRRPGWAAPARAGASGMNIGGRGSGMEPHSDERRVAQPQVVVGHAAAARQQVERELRRGPARRSARSPRTTRARPARRAGCSRRSAGARPRRPSVAANDVVAEASRNAQASATASSIASFVPEPIEKCAVCAASPSSTTLSAHQRALRTVTKLIHLELLAMQRGHRRARRRTAAAELHAATSLSPGPITRRSEPEPLCHVPRASRR